MRLALIASTGGSVAGRLMADSPFFRSRIKLLASDRECGALAVAAGHGVETVNLQQPDAGLFCDALLELFEQHQIDYAIAFYTKLLRGRLLETYRGRIINTHLSLLPAFSGFHALDRALAHGCRYVGTTMHAIDDSTDGGHQLIQSVISVDPSAAKAALRHRLFVHQCKTVLQVVKWLDEGRILDGMVVRDAGYTNFEFSPDLDFDEAIRFSS